MAFPTDPTNGQTTTQNGINYTYNSTLTAWTVGTQAAGNISGNNINITSTAAVGTTLTVTGAATLSSTLAVTANITGGNILTGGLLSATGNVSGGNLVVTGNIVDTAALSILSGANGNITLSPNGTGVVISTANTIPSANATYDLGSTTARWKTVFTSDLDLNNGIGDWTIVEGEDDLFLYNNKKGRVFKFALIEVDPATATPKIDGLK